MSFQSVITACLQVVGADVKALRERFKKTPHQLNSVHDIDADTSLTSGSAWNALSVGDYVFCKKEAIAFVVVAALSVAADRVTANGVNLAYVAVDGRYDVRAFGATGDGSTNDTAAIQAAIDRAGEQTLYTNPNQGARNTHNGAVVFFPTGRYACNTLDVAKAGVAMVGASVTNVMVMQIGGGVLFNVRDPDEENGGEIHNIAIENMDLRGTLTDPTAVSVAIDIGIVKHCYITNVRFGGFRTDIWERGTKEPCFITNCNFFAGNAVTSNTTDGGGVHIRFDSAILSATSPARSYDQVDPDNTSVGYAHCVMTYITGCEFRNGLDAKGVAFELLSTDGVYCSNCHFINVADVFIRVDQKSAISPVVNVKFDGCFFDGETAYTESILNIAIPSFATTANVASISMDFANCKFNGCGTIGETEAAAVTCRSPHVTRLSIDGGFFNKIRGTYWVRMLAGKGEFSIRNCTFVSEANFVPSAFIILQGATAGNYFANAMISGNLFTSLTGAARSTHNIRVAGVVNNVGIVANQAQAATSASGDGIVYANPTAGTVLKDANLIFT